MLLQLFVLETGGPNTPKYLRNLSLCFVRLKCSICLCIVPVQPLYLRHSAITNYTKVIQLSELLAILFLIFINLFVMVTIYLQGCFASKQCSCRYLNSTIKLKLIYVELTVKLYQKNELPNFS